MPVEDLLAAISVLSKLGEDDRVDAVLRRANADLGAKLAEPRPLTPPAATPTPPHIARRRRPRKTSAAAPPAPLGGTGARLEGDAKGADIPLDVLEWLQASSPSELARALGKQRKSVYTWRRTGRCSPEALQALIAVYERTMSGAAASETGDASELELEIRARCASDGLTREDFFELAGVEDLGSDASRQKVRELLETI